MKVAIKILLVIIVLACGITAARYFIKHPRKATRQEVKPKPALVETIEAGATDRKANLTAMGTVVPAVQIELQAQVSGRIIEQSPDLIAGGRFNAGDVILRIDPRDYEFAVAQKVADVEKAEFELKVEQGSHTIARREWDLLEGDVPVTQEGRDLALRKPHLRQKKAALDAARSALEKAQLDLERTTIRAPFNALVLDEAVDPGQVVSPQTRLATLVGTDAFHVQVTAPANRLDWIDLPGPDGAQGSLAAVSSFSGSELLTQCQGRVIRLLPDIAPGGRMAQLLVEIDDPLGLKLSSGERKLPILLNTYVRVEINGKNLKHVFELPRKAIREGDRVWVMSRDNTLDVRNVDLLWGDENTVLIRDSIEEGERIIISRIGTPIPGMKLRLDGDEEDADDEAGQGASQ